MGHGCSLMIKVEINPLAVIEDPTHQEHICCVDAKLNFDGDAQFRQQEIFKLRDKVFMLLLLLMK